jgi:hypothetical protein
MRQFIAVALALFSAALAPALVFSSILLALGGKDALPTLALAFVAAFVVALAHVLVLGLPVSGWLMRLGRFKFRPMLLFGFIVGLVPVAIWAQPYKYSDAQYSSWSEGVQKYRGGIPTLAGWLDYLELITSAGALGAVGGAVFYFVYRSISPNNSFKPKPLRGSA